MERFIVMIGSCICGGRHIPIPAFSKLGPRRVMVHPLEAGKADYQESQWCTLSPKASRYETQEKTMFQLQSEGGKKPMN